MADNLYYLKKKIVLLLSIAFGVASTFAVGQSKIDLSSVRLSVHNNSFEGRDVSFMLDQRDKEERLIMSAGGADVKASFRIKNVKERHKGPGVRLTIKYTCYYLGDKRKNKHEVTFWPADTRTLKESIDFSFEKAPDPLRVTLAFDGLVVF